MKDSNTAFFYLNTIETVAIVIENIFTIYVFWKNRATLKLSSYFLGNLAVTDRLVRIMEILVIGDHRISFTQRPNHQNLLAAFQTTFSLALLIVFSVLVSPERSYTLLWPLRHRISTMSRYIYSAILAWVALGSHSGVMCLLAVYDLLELFHWTVTYLVVIHLRLTVICASCLTIRKRLSQRDPCLDMARDKQNVSGPNAKVSRTFYIVIAMSLVRWFPCIVIYCVNFLCSKCLLTYLIHLSATLRLANSLINPIIQSFRILTFRETLLRIIICKKS